MKEKLTLLSTFFILILSGCSEDEVIETPEFTINMPGLVEASHTYYSVSADVGKHGSIPITAHGFVFSQINNPTIENAQIIDLGTLSQDRDKFYGDFKGAFEPGKRYFIRAFIRTDNNIVYYTEAVIIDSLPGDWKKLASFPGPHRRLSIVFVLNGKAYVMGGKSLEEVKYSDLWVYDPLFDEWIEKSNLNFGSITSEEGGVFVVENIAYLVTKDDLLKYEVDSDNWLSIGEGVPGDQKQFTVFAIGNKGYAGNGHFDGWFYEYNVINNEWTAKAKYPGEAMYQRYGMSNNSNGYVGFGDEWPSNSFANEFYAYDPVRNEWIQKTSFLGFSRIRKGMSFFSLNNKIYMGMGRNINDFDFADLFEYNPAQNEWFEMKSMDGEQRSEAISFSINNKGYVGLGLRYYNGGRVDKLTDLWEFERP